MLADQEGIWIYIVFLLQEVECFSFQENDEGQYNNKEKCFWSSGTCYMVKENLFQKAGGFDENIFCTHGRDRLCWRLYAMGFEVG